MTDGIDEIELGSKVPLVVICVQPPDVIRVKCEECLRSAWLGDMRDARLSSRCIMKLNCGRYEQQAPDGVTRNVRNAPYSA